MNKKKTLYQCPECGLFYKEKKWASECRAWCEKHKSCNLGITKHAIKKEVKNMVKLELLTTPGCVHCAEAKTILERVKKDYPELKVDEVDMATPRGQEMITKYQIMASPGVVINGELFSTGGLNEKKLREKLETLKKK